MVRLFLKSIVNQTSSEPAKKVVWYYRKSDNSCPFLKWRAGLSVANRLIATSMQQELEDGVFSDKRKKYVKCGKKTGLWELKYNGKIGSVLRIYYREEAERFVFFWGSDKRQQSDEIAKAYKLLEEYRNQ